jgi:hypothetical protein
VVIGYTGTVKMVIGYMGDGEDGDWLYRGR